jgi:hypothetical protein
MARLEPGCAYSLGLDRQIQAKTARCDDLAGASEPNPSHIRNCWGCEQAN